MNHHDMYVDRTYYAENKLADERERREQMREQAEKDMAYEFTRSIELGDPDHTPDWTGTTPDYDAARKLGIAFGSKGMPYRRTTVAEAFAESLDYTGGPDAGDVVKVLSLALHCTDPVVSLAARQLVERAAAKFAEHHAPEGDDE